jgi:hypothetical protein
LVDPMGQYSNADSEVVLTLRELIAGRYLDNKWWMKLSLPHPPESWRLLVAGSVCWIISGLDLGEPLHAGGMDFGYTVFERSTLNLIFDFAIPREWLQA